MRRRTTENADVLRLSPHRDDALRLHTCTVHTVMHWYNHGGLCAVGVHFAGRERQGENFRPVSRPWSSSKLLLSLVRVILTRSKHGHDVSGATSGQLCMLLHLR